MTDRYKARPRNSVREQFEEGTNDGTTPAAAGKGAYTFISPEEVICDQIYAFTYNPKMQPLDSKQVLHCEKNFVEEVAKHLQSLPNLQFQLNCEISSTGRWHFHGVCLWEPEKVAGFYAWDIHRLMARGTVCIKPIQEEYSFKETKGLKGWISYCNKQYECIKTYLDKREIPYTICSEIFNDSSWEDIMELYEGTERIKA